VYLALVFWLGANVVSNSSPVSKASVVNSFQQQHLLISLHSFFSAAAPGQICVMPCCAALCYAVGQEHWAKQDRGKRVQHAVCQRQSVESVGRASCAESDQASKLCHVTMLLTLPHKHLFTSAEICMIKLVLLLPSEGDTILVTMRHKQANMERRGKNISPPNQGGTVERTSCPW